MTSTPYAALFQSTRPTWGATIDATVGSVPPPSFNPRAPRGARLNGFIHLSLRSRVSIHAPHVGRDKLHYALDNCGDGFNPRAPRGARPTSSTVPPIRSQFQSTRPTWGATRYRGCSPAMAGCFNPRAPRGARRTRGIGPSPIFAVSIHAPHVGRDASNSRINIGGGQFQSTRPTWGATKDLRIGAGRHDVSIHAPHVGRDSASVRIARSSISFNPRAPRGARQVFPGPVSN